MPARIGRSTIASACWYAPARSGRPDLDFLRAAGRSDYDVEGDRGGETWPPSLSGATWRARRCTTTSAMAAPRRRATSATAHFRLDRRPGAPPRCPAGVVCEKREHDLARRMNCDDAIERMRKIHERVLFLEEDGRRPRLGFGPRRVASSSAASFSRHSASSHIRSSQETKGPSLLRSA